MTQLDVQHNIAVIPNDGQEGHVPATGAFHIRPMHLSQDIDLIHCWVNKDYAQYWGMQGTTLQQVRAMYEETLKHAQVYLGYYAGKAAFLLECYDPATDLLGKYYEVLPGDRGMHILVAPVEVRIPSFTWSIFKVIMDFIFKDAAVMRVVVEPDIRNYKIHVLNKRAGFEYEKILELPHKIARLAFCTRVQHAEALLQEHIKDSNIQDGQSIS